MEKIVKFGNKGEIDPVMWNTFGVSVKQNKRSAIGQFGTGLKYAIAVLMRENRQFYIKSCGQTYTFTKESKTIRGETFEQIFCNDERLPFTTHLGSHWELWQAYRELYSNCLDEGGEFSDGTEYDTLICAEIGDIAHHEVFLDPSKLPIILSEGCDVYTGNSNHLYYKNVRILDYSEPAMYTYNLKGSVALTEDRTLKSTGAMLQTIGNTVITSDNEEFLQNILLKSRGYKEEHWDFYWADKTPQEPILELYKNCRRNSQWKQDSLVKLLQPFLGKDQYRPSSENLLHNQRIDKAKEFLAKLGHIVTHPIIVTNDLPQNTLAIADSAENKIYMSERVMTQGMKQIVSTLLEEHLHLELGLVDLTYDMQSYLFDQIITMGERVIGEIL